MTEIPAHVFTHVPELKGAIIHWEDSFFRGGVERFEEMDAMAAKNGLPPDWRLSHEAREENRRAVLAGREGQDLWTFAYGSLMWDPGVEIAEIRRATLPGWHRSFCLRLTIGRGSLEAPGLMAALEAGGESQGLVMRIEADKVEGETEMLWMREMVAGAYHPFFAPCDTPQGRVDALAFAINSDSERYFRCDTQSEAAGMIARATGRLGPNIDYLEKLMEQLERLGLEDRELAALLAEAQALQAQE